MAIDRVGEDFFYSNDGDGKVKRVAFGQEGGSRPGPRNLQPPSLS